MAATELIIETIGWIASLLIVGSYALNITGKLSASSVIYVVANIIGGIFFVVNTFYHKAYPSMLVNACWVIIAIYMLGKHGLHKKKE